MSQSSSVVLILILIIGVLAGATFYFYNKSQSPSNSQNQTVANSSDFRADLPTATPKATNSKVDQLTKPAQPKGRLSYPANVYRVTDKDTLFSIGETFSLPWLIIKEANSLPNENSIQADMFLAIPKVDERTDLFRINFIVDDAAVTDKNRELHSVDSSEWYDPLAIAKKYALGYFYLADTDTFKLGEANLADGTAAVNVTNKDGKKIVVGLIQPKTRGEKGLWVIYYIEEQ